MLILTFLVVLTTSIWVLLDAKKFGVKMGQMRGVGYLGPWGWFFACLFLWIVAFPYYLVKRHEFKKVIRIRTEPTLDKSANSILLVNVKSDKIRNIQMKRDTLTAESSKTINCLDGEKKVGVYRKLARTYFELLIVSVVGLYLSYRYKINWLDVLSVFAFLVGLFGSLIKTFSANELHRVLRRHEEKQKFLEAGGDDIKSLTPVQFEQYCGILLEDAGWKVRYTAATGDFGADIIAERNKERMIVQCKHYSGSVGVSAVQEAFSARSYYHAHKACVVASRGRFTRSARSLAENNGVILVSSENLNSIQ
ncbi:restriction endonuclease [Acidithiobacillus montserratensis]|uniref:Restriction endonuclease n=1 Tax=Acidithiobacillus montserratensis TaxID=2729135 RepID=A0ACD5HI89_9PROT|nr:restriction endonuclease [Acidithiobacillus montserratensis]MBU2747816.1 restriction endonuclease [Acidithiobacillus montserratensis]